MLVDLPLVMTNGLFKNIEELNEEQITDFLRYLINFETERFGTQVNSVPPWWGDEVLYPHGFHLGRIPIPYTRSKLAKLRTIVKNCYASHNCEDLLELSSKLAKLHVFEYHVIRNSDNTVTISQKDSNSPMVVIPASNLDYDYHKTNGKFGKVREVTIYPMTKPKPDLSAVTIELSDSDEDDCTVVIADSSSDDELQIVSYTPPTKSFKPVSPAKRIHGPKCPLSHKRHPGSAGAKRPLVDRRFVQNRTTSIPQRHDRNKVVYLVKDGSRIVTVDLLDTKSESVPSPKALQPMAIQNSGQCRPGDRRVIVGNVAHHHNCSKVLPLKSEQTPRRLEEPVRRRRRLLSLTRRNKPQEFIDLTFEEELPAKEHRGNLQNLPKDDVLSILNLAPKGAEPVKAKIEHRPAERRILKQANLSKKLRVNMQKTEICQVDRMVSLGLFPKNCLCSAVELGKRMENIEHFTRTDLTFYVDLSDTASVARLVRKCSVPLVRLNSAAIRKWRKPLNPL